MVAVPDDLVICEGGYPGRAAIWAHDQPIHFQKALHRVRFHEPEHAKWVLYYLHSCDLDGTLRQNFNGAGIQHFTGEALSRFRVPLPPLAEQRRIVAILDEAFASIAVARANAEKNLQNARELFEAHLNNALSMSKVGWQDKELGDLCDFENGDRGKNYPSKAVQTSSGVPFINAGHLMSSGLDMDGMTYIPRERFTLLGSGKIKKGDILFCLRGSLGKFASVGDLAEGAIASSLVILRPSSYLLSDFLLLYLRSTCCSSMIDKFKNGAAQPNLSADSLKRFRILLPPREEQAVIVTQLKKLSSETLFLESVYQRKLAALQELKQSLLHDAFSGRL